MSAPSQEAFQVAQRIASMLPHWPSIEEIAQTIDRELQLPQRNAALLLAQSVCDLDPWALDELRDALAVIKTQ